METEMQIESKQSQKLQQIRLVEDEAARPDPTHKHAPLFKRIILIYLHFVVGEAAEGKQPAMTSCHSASSKPAVVREFPVRCPDTTWKHFRITSLAVAASFLRKTDERLCHLELRDDFFTCLSWSSAFKPCFPLCGLFSSLSPAPLCIYAWKPEAASFAGRSLLINKTWSGDDDD